MAVLILIVLAEILALLWFTGLKLVIRQHARLIERGARVEWVPNIPGWMLWLQARSRR